MSSLARVESERVLARMEELYNLSLEEVKKRARNINHNLTMQELRDLKNQVWDDFSIRISQEFSTDIAKEFANLMKGSFKLQIFGSPLVEKTVSQIM